MALSIKELIVVLVVALLVFKILGPLVDRFAPDADLKRRRFAWCALTAMAFLSPNVWLFSIAATPLLIFTGKRDSNPTAAYLFLYYTVPPFTWRVPMIGISYLVYLTPTLLISFCIMAFQAVRMLNSPMPRRPWRFDFTDFCVLGYVLITAFFFVLPETSPGILMTYTYKECIRRVFELLFTLYVPYFVISRSLLSYRAMLDAMASAILAAAVMAAIGLFEASKHWLLYEEIIDRFSGGGHFAVQYLVRGGHLRAMASSGQPLGLAYILGIAFGFWLGIHHHVESRRTNILTLCLLLSGLYVTHSIGPSIGAAAIFLIFSALRPGSGSRALKVVAVAGIIGVGILQLSDPTVLMSHIPLLRSWQQNGDYLYRVRLFDRAERIFDASPLFGDQEALLKMQDLRQGQGIIDLVNGYVLIFLGSGIVGLSLWASFVTSGMLRVRAWSRELRLTDPKLSMIGTALLACTLGTLFIMASSGSMDPMICILTGLSMACARLCNSAEASASDSSFALGG